MTPLTLIHSGGTRTLTAYSVVPRQHAVARHSERDRGTAFARGDHRPLPVELVVTALLPGVFATATDLAYTIITEADATTAAFTHEGQYGITGFLGYDIRPDGPAVVLTLRFAGVGPYPPSVVRAERGTLGVTAHAPTVAVSDLTVANGVLYGTDQVVYGTDAVVYGA